MSSWLKRIIILVWVAFFIGIGSFTTLIYMIKNNFNGYFGEMPGIEFIENPSSELASELYSADGVLLGKYFRKNRTNVDYEEISPNLIK